MGEYVKRFVTKDGKQRVTIYRDDHAENPRYNTDEPLHCEDWSRRYSIMCKSERECHKSSARDRIIQLLVYYGKSKAIIDMLVENGKHMTDGKNTCDNALVYDRSMKRWVLMEFGRAFGSKEFTWEEVEYFDGRKDDIDFGQMLEFCLDSTIDKLCDGKYWTDDVKIASYGFDYYGSISFDDEFSTDSEGIAWLEKDEFMKYSGCDEKQWNGKTLREIEFLCDEIEAWTNDDVYGFMIERAVRKIVNTRYPDGEHDDTEENVVDWEETDSCWGFYGGIEKSLEWILSETGFEKDNLIEE